MEYIDITTQNELNAAIAAGNYPHITGNGRYEIPADIPRGHTIKISGSAKPTLVAYGTSSPSVEANGTSSPSVVAYGTSSPRVVAYGTSSPSVVAYGTSSPSVVANGTSSPRVEAYDTSSPRVEANGTSSPSVVANDYSGIIARGPVTISAAGTATVRAAGTQPTVTGGALVQRVPLTTNPGLVRGVLTHIEAHPAEWDQGVWARQTDCGTAYCYAGHAVAMVGGRMNIEDSTVEVATLPEALRSRFVNEHVQISAAARIALGLDPVTADRLFNGSNGLEDLRELVEEICAGTEPGPAAVPAVE